MNQFRVRFINGKYAGNAIVPAVKASTAVKRVMDHPEKGAPMKLKKGEFVTIAIERIG
jgi:hypothetical protein